MPKKEPTPPTPEVVAQLQRELTPDLLRSLRMWADRACARLLALEGRDDPAYVSIMVQDAIGDTYAGIRTWEPSRRILRHHLARVIQSRVSHDVERARRRRHVSFHEVDDSNDENPAAVAMSLRRDDERTRPDGRLAILEGRARLFVSLRALSSDDADVLALLDAYEAGHVRRDEAMAHLGWTLPHHVNVRRRLDTSIRCVPPDVKATALEILTRDGGAPPLSIVRPADRSTHATTDLGISDDQELSNSDDGGGGTDDSGDDRVAA